MDNAVRERTPFFKRPFFKRSPSRRAQIVLGVLLAALVLLIVLFDWNWFKRPLEMAVQASTGRQLRIDGDLDVDLGRVTRLMADRISFANAEWSKEPIMASADRVEVGFEIWPLLFEREARIPEIRLAAPKLRLETGPQGVGNWVFGGDSDGNPVQFRRIWIEDGRLQFFDTPKKTDIDIAVNSLQAQGRNTAPPIEIKGRGRWIGNAFDVSGRAESPLELSNSEEPYRIDLHANAGPTRAHARGNLLNPFELRYFNLQFTLAGRDMEDLYPLIGIATPSTPPYKLDGRLIRKADLWRYQDFTGVVGDSDLSGTANVTLGRKRPLLEANLVSKRLDLDDLAGFLGAPPQVGGNETTNPELKAQALQLAADTRVLPDKPYDLGKLRSMDADVRLKAHRINAPSLPLDDMDAHLKLNDGILELAPLNFGVAGGDIRSTIRMDARESPIRTRAQVSARRLNLSRLFPDVKLTQDAVGLIGGDIAIAGTGNSIAAMLGSADGDIALGMGCGQISNLLMELAGIDIAEALKFLLTKDRKVPIRCAFGDFAVKDGLMQSRALAFDTEDTIIVGQGNINLKNETLDLELRPRPKDRSILALRSPPVVGGTFKDPSFHPDFKRLGLRGAVAVTLGSIAPPAALLATLELGPGKDSSCGGKYAK
ncbi:AsmA family protein [Pseudoxanthomonas sacheonensis]|uniref:AsmA family protein n=1 Tax=Pseudoxanthomonas sacheonensis TaxID=443615 RepID=UPI0013CF45C4|nr:AsmA family protein [Pseudoxanthomonas sacheonensis]KAF1712911.1 AsmA family protein [Pseudoxanthomonas sacheonensis]